MLHTVRFLCAVVMLLMATSPLFAMPPANTGSSFSYQGRLTDNGGSPQTGSFDFEFKLYDAAAAGSQVSTTVSTASVTVTNGIFTVMLDFGATAFDGSQRWLEIDVRSSGGGAYATLAPRQELNAVPYAVQVINGAIGANQIGTAVNGMPGQALMYSSTSTTGVTWATVAIEDVFRQVDATIATVETTANTFVFGSMQLEDVTTSTSDDARVFYSKEKGSLFAGTFEEDVATDWDNDLIGENAISLGHNNIASGDHSIAMGSGNTASGRGAVALGSFDSGSGSGNFNKAVGFNSLALGNQNNLANGDYSVAIGNNGNTATGNYSISLGHNENGSVADYSIAVGDNANKSNGSYSLAMGRTDNACSTYSIAIGSNFNRAHSYSIAIGSSDNRSTAQYTLALGSNSNNAASDYSISVGRSDNKTNGMYSLAMGQGSNNTGADYTIAIGNNSNSASNSYSLAMGSADNRASGTYSQAMGSNDNKASGDYSEARGSSNNHASGNYTLAIGTSENIAEGNYSLALGSNRNRADGDYSFAFGSSENIAHGSHSAVLGFDNEAEATSSMAFGRGASAHSYGEIALGLYNTKYTANNTSARDDDDRLLVIGNGESELSRADALTIWKSGKVDIPGELCATSLTVTVGVTAANISIGTSGTVIEGLVKRTVSHDISSVSGFGFADETISVAGATTGATVSVSTESLLPAGLILSSTKSNNGSVTLRLYNATGGAIDPASMEFYITVIK